MGLMDKVKKKFHKPTQGEINREQIKTAEELTVLREGVATELDKLTFINTMPACGDPPENFDDEAEYENWKMRSNAREAWSNRLKIYKGMRDHLLKELNEESVTRLNTRKLDRLNEELVEWLGEALKLRDEETADWAFLALDYGICTARKDILHCEETDEENIREKRIDTLGTYKSMVEISRQINDLNKQVQEEEEKMELSDAAIETFGAQIKDLKEKYPLAKEYVEIYGPQNAPTNAPGQRVHVQEIVNAMERYSAAYHNKNAAAGKVALCKSKIAAQKDAIENLRHLLKKVRRKFPRKR